MRTAIGLLSLAGTAIFAASASAAVVARIEIIAENDAGIARWSQEIPASLDGAANWGDVGPISGQNPPAPIATFANGVAIYGAGIGWIHDPVVTSNFNVAAGLSNTTITINSVILSFDPIINGSALANASITVTDSATFGTPGQVSIAGLQAGNRAFAARVNGGTDLFSLVDGSSQLIPSGSTYTYTGANAGFPNFDAVGGSVNEIRSQFRFTLSAGDRAAGTSYFEIIPAPGASALLALGGLLAARRRR